MLLRPEYLSLRLDRPLPTKDSGILRTIRDACDYMTAMDKKRELRSHWQRVAKLILAKEDVLTVSRALDWRCSWMPSWTCPKSRRNENLDAFRPPHRHAERCRRSPRAPSQRRGFREELAAGIATNNKLVAALVCPGTAQPGRSRFVVMAGAALPLGGRKGWMIRSAGWRW